LEQVRLQEALRGLQESPSVEVAFVIDAEGALLGWAGASAAFSPTGQFAPMGQGEAEQNLYLCALGARHFLGVLFVEGADPDAVREAALRQQQALEAALSAPPEGGRP
jgi:hypothetical protein